MIPVSIVTGFLGSGKTTLIARLLRNPGFERTAVIINEWGEIGLDHDLIAAADDISITLTTGCLCCRMSSNLGATLRDLHRSRGKAERFPYDRVLIETSGMADPGPILRALISDPGLSQTHKIDSVLTLVDAQHGTANLERHDEARRQVALADRLLLTKSDVLATSPTRLIERIRALNHSAPLLSAIKGDISPELLFAGLETARFVALDDAFLSGQMSPFLPVNHATAINTFTIRRERPIPALALALWLKALTDHCGPKLLRLKGLVEVTEMPGRPAAIHAVQHAVSEPEWLDHWPSTDRDSRVVFICENVPRYFPARLLDAIEQEVLDEMQR